MKKLLFNFYYALAVTTSIFARRPSNHTNFLSKFHQDDYKLVYERAELARSNPNLAKVEIRTFKFNRTTPVTNGSFIYTLDLGMDMEITIQAYKFASNEYRLFPMRFQLNLCETLAFNVIGLNKISEKGNIVCPLVKNKKYFFYNFVPDESQFPPLVPSGRYMQELQFLYHSKEIFAINGYATIDRPIPISSA